MKKFLITGVKSGLGKYLHRSIPDSLGLDRENFDSIKNENFDTIIHCAFNKENIITNYKKYLDDNVFLIQRLKNLNYNKFIYISSIDVYQKNPNMYTHFKRFAESILNEDDLILRCSMMVGEDMKENHLSKIQNNISSIGLSKESKFNYILMKDLAEFFIDKEHKNYKGIIDFVSNSSIELQKVKEYFNSNTILGEHTYESDFDFQNPIFILNNKYNKSSLDNLKQYYGK
jgi:nucleoside-diphosphate-sugar epimerase